MRVSTMIRSSPGAHPDSGLMDRIADFGRQARRRHLLDALDGDTLVGSAVKAEHRRLQLGGDVDREFRLQFRARRSIDPYQATAALRPTWEAGPNARMINLSALEVPGSPVAVLEVRIHLPPAANLSQQ